LFFSLTFSNSLAYSIFCNRIDIRLLVLLLDIIKIGKFIDNIDFHKIGHVFIHYLFSSYSPITL